MSELNLVTKVWIGEEEHKMEEFTPEQFHQILKGVVDRAMKDINFKPKTA